MNILCLAYHLHHTIACPSLQACEDLWESEGSGAGSGVVAANQDVSERVRPLCRGRSMLLFGIP